MKISLEWLSDFVTWTEADPLAIADTITLSMAEVEDVEVQGRFLHHCCVGRIVSLQKHPKADRLSLADVDTDRGRVRVVCGGTNLREGMLVAFAHVGATVRWHGGETVTLATTTIRGEESNGMICAAEELEIADIFPPAPEHGERPVVDLSATGLAVGADLRTALGRSDTILHISNKAIPHRPDLFSHLGVARECVALGLATWKEKPRYDLPAFSKKNPPLACVNEIEDLVPRYLSCTIDISGVGETPAWMKRRLEATGWRSINLPIDITNYVATEVGMPLHSFDADDIRGTVRFRTSRDGEAITTLDGVERALPEGAIVLSDDEGIFDLLGIMGGLRSSTKSTTRRIYLHSAIVSPVAIRRAIMATGHRTDASTVYEKGIPRVTAAIGFARALALMLEHVPGATVTSALDTWGEDGACDPITVSMERMQSALGVQVTAAEATAALKALECTVVAKGKTLTVTPPLHRPKDLKTEWDIIEEIARLRGFASIDEAMPSAHLQIPQRDTRITRMRRSLQEDGFFELVPLSLVGPTLLTKAGMSPAAALRIADPLGEEHSLMAPSLLPRLLEHAGRRLQQTDDALRTVAISAVHDGAREYTELSMLVTHRRETALVADPFLAASSALVQACSAAGYRAVIEQSTSDIPPYAHPGRCGTVRVDGLPVGTIAEVHPTVRGAFDLPFRTAVVLLDLTALLAQPCEDVLAQPLPSFPAVTYDLTVPRRHSKPVGELMAALAGSHPLLRSVVVADLYHAPSQAPDEYNLTLRCTYRSDERTLTEEEVKTAHQTVTSLAQQA